MSMTIDKLRVDHRVTVLRDFTDAAGVTMRAGQSGILRGLSFDQLRLEIHMEIETADAKVALLFPLKAATGPRNGHMQEYFELGEDVSVPRPWPPQPRPNTRTMIIPPTQEEATNEGPVWWREAQSLGAEGRLKEAEEAILRAVPHIGAAASVAEMHAKRMRAYQCAGDEARAVEAFRLAVQWMGTYASQATSGGEGAALSYERDQFQESLAREFGYDPTEPGD